MKIVIGDIGEWTSDKALVACCVCGIGVLVPVSKLFEELSGSEKQLYVHENCAKEVKR